MKQQTHTRDSTGHNEERKHASPGEAVGNVYFFGFVFCFFCIFQVFYAKKKTTYYLYNQKKTHLYKKEKTQLKDK